MKSTICLGFLVCSIWLVSVECKRAPRQHRDSNRENIHETALVSNSIESRKESNEKNIEKLAQDLKSITAKSHHLPKHRNYHAKKSRHRANMNVCGESGVMKSYDNKHYCLCTDENRYGLNCQTTYENPCQSSRISYAPVDIAFTLDGHSSRRYFIHCSWNVPHILKCPINTVWNNHFKHCADDDEDYDYDYDYSDVVNDISHEETDDIKVETKQETGHGDVEAHFRNQSVVTKQEQDTENENVQTKQAELDTNEAHVDDFYENILSSTNERSTDDVNLMRQREKISRLAYTKPRYKTSRMHQITNSIPTNDQEVEAIERDEMLDEIDLKNDDVGMARDELTSRSHEEQTSTITTTTSASIIEAIMRTSVSNSPNMSDKLKLEKIFQDIYSETIDPKNLNLDCQNGILHNPKEYGDYPYCMCPGSTIGLSCNRAFLHPCFDQHGSYFSVHPRFTTNIQLTKSFFIQCDWSMPRLKKCARQTEWNNEIQTCVMNYNPK